MLASSHPPPRTFRNKPDKAAVDFLQSYCGSLAIDEDPTALLQSAVQIAKGLARVGKVDLGSMSKTDRDFLMQLVLDSGGEAEWVPAWEELLGIEFPVSGAESKVQKLCRKSKKRKELYSTEGGEQEEEEEVGLGARLLLSGEIDQMKFDLSDFPEMKCKLPSVTPITESDFHYIKDVAYTKVFSQFGNVKWDQTLRQHVGDRLQELFPKLPDRGKILGEHRSFVSSLRWRASNPRKSMNKHVSEHAPPAVLPTTQPILSNSHTAHTK